MSADLSQAWQAACDRYRDIDNSVARFNMTLLDALRPRWEQIIQPDTSMFRLLFTKPGATFYSFGERVEVEAVPNDRVRMELVRQVPRRGEQLAAGSVTVTGDLTRPENALPAVEALLLQLADPASA